MSPITLGLLLGQMPTAFPPQLLFTEDNTARVAFVSTFQGRWKKCNDQQVFACVTWDQKHKPVTMVLPNPCDPDYAEQTFAVIACHELRHWNGWPGDHPYTPR